MGLLVLGLAVFFAVHLVPSLRLARAALIARHGEGRYKGLFSLAAFVGLALIVAGKANADFVAVYDPPAWGRAAAMHGMPVAFILLAASRMPTNIRRVTAHPMLWGIAVWSVLHLLANGDLASLLLFGAFALYSMYAMWAQTQRGAKPAFSAEPVKRDIIVVVAGVAAYAVLLHLHRWIAGVPLV